MPSKSKSQQRFFGMVRAYQKGDLKGSEVGKKVKKAAKSMSKKDVKDFAKTKHKGLPNHVKNKKINENNMNFALKKHIFSGREEMNSVLDDLYEHGFLEDMFADFLEKTPKTIVKGLLKKHGIKYKKDIDEVFDQLHYQDEAYKILSELDDKNLGDLLGIYVDRYEPVQESKNKMRVFNITEEQYREILRLLEDKNTQNQVSVGLTNPTEQDENPNNLSNTIAKTERASRAAGIQPGNANIEAEMNINGQAKEVVVKSEKNESVLITKRQINEMRIHERNKHSKVVKLKDFIG